MLFYSHWDYTVKIISLSFEIWFLPIKGCFALGFTLEVPISQKLVINLGYSGLYCWKNTIKMESSVQLKLTINIFRFSASSCNKTKCLWCIMDKLTMDWITCMWRESGDSFSRLTPWFAYLLTTTLYWKSLHADHHFTQTTFTTLNNCMFSRLPLYIDQLSICWSPMLAYTNYLYVSLY